MVKHIVLFKFNIEGPASQNETVQQFGAALMDLRNTISVVRSIEVGYNSNPTEDYHLALTVTVDNMEDLATYANHPLHLAAGAIKSPINQSRACVDYIY